MILDDVQMALDERKDEIPSTGVCDKINLKVAREYWTQENFGKDVAQLRKKHSDCPEFPTLATVGNQVVGYGPGLAEVRDMARARGFDNHQYLIVFGEEFVPGQMGMGSELD